MANLLTSFLNRWLIHPLICSASPLSADLDNIKRMEDAGAAAVVLPSLFEEQIFLAGSDVLSQKHRPSSQLYSLPAMDQYNLGPDQYLDLLRRAKETVQIPIVASLNAFTRGGWINFAGQIEQTGADALELSLYHIPTDPARTAADIEQNYLDLVKDIRGRVKIPLSVKLGSFFTAPANFAMRLDELGINSLVLFNRFYQPDINPQLLEIQPSLRLSTPAELPLRLHWAAILFGKIHADIAITGGVHSGTDVAKAMLAGARAVMIASALLKNGIDYLKTIRTELEEWLDQSGYESLHQIQGNMSFRFVSDTALYERANYMQVLRTHATSYKNGGD